MLILLRILKEGFLFAWNELTINKLRTLLSLLGITIGISVIISVFTILDSMENAIRKNIEVLGENVIYIDRAPWILNMNFPWWKIMNRPVPKLKESIEINNKCKNAEAVAFNIPAYKTVKYKSNYMKNTLIMATSHDYDKIRMFEIEQGRYFTQLESKVGKNIAIIGKEIVNYLFENQNPIGKQISIMGRKITVVGVFKKEGESMFGGNNLDNIVLLPVNFARNFIDIENKFSKPLIMVKAKPKVTNNELIEELKGIMRTIRRLKPNVEDNFSLNQISMITQSFDIIFMVIDIAAWIIGGFSILVGGFGIANIMFVSVKERTNIIGIQKSLGAKNYFILLQYLFESSILSLIGGILGLIVVYLGIIVVDLWLDIHFTLTLNNILLGVCISIVIGIVSGIAPAYTASRLSPVKAINKI